MTYNWEEIFKSKSDKELLQIYQGKTMINGDAIEFAKHELLNRGVDFENLDNYYKRKKIESMLADKDNTRRVWLLEVSKKTQRLVIGILGILFALSGFVDLIFKHIEYSNIADRLKDDGIMIIGGLGLSIFGFLSYRKNKRAEIERKALVDEILDNLEK